MLTKTRDALNAAENPAFLSPFSHDRKTLNGFFDCVEELAQIGLGAHLANQTGVRLDPTALR
jgi:hypothetical protein